ncbi:hypothetical protein LWI28_026203 [Acer negundo]|uniref:Uncharacterized protein n=1 Tax=Acer negundo TaxID=4023 RepID=A0AAD5J8G7_ACENE|nr:hypothetical protein LWI28_026203 [Acer negundo]
MGASAQVVVAEYVPPVAKAMAILRGQRSDIGGLFSCFGNAFRCEISITCRGGNKKKSNGKVCNLSSDDGSSVAQSSSYV